MTKSIENPTINLPKESDVLIKLAFKKRKTSNKIIQKNKKNKKLEWLNEI